jgi:hypothetical protein
VFLSDNPEKLVLNQYWFSPFTIKSMVADLNTAKKIAFLSTPSLYFSIDSELRSNSNLFDLDEKWASDAGFVKYNYKEPEAIDDKFNGQFDFVAIDPPFITEDAWEKYAVLTKRILAPGGRMLLTTIFENEQLMQKLLGCHRARFRPSIPNLIYQYSLFINYESATFAELNPEIDPVDPPLDSRKKSTLPGFGSS